MHYLPVLSASGERLMPCHAARARQLIRQGKAVKRFDRGLCYLQPIALGIDPGSKKEGYTVQGQQQTYLNLQANAVTWVKAAMETRRSMRRSRRQRKTPCRARRTNRARGGLPPSTRARWGWKLRIARWLARYYPINRIVIEDVAAVTKPQQRRWNQSFSPLAVGKQWCYDALERLAPVLPVPSHYYERIAGPGGLGQVPRETRRPLGGPLYRCVRVGKLWHWWAVAPHAAPSGVSCTAAVSSAAIAAAPA